MSDPTPDLSADARQVEQTYPYPPNPGQTHYDGCWRTAGHHNCAVARVYALEEELVELRAALAGLVQVIETDDLLPPSLSYYAEARALLERSPR